MTSTSCPVAARASTTRHTLVVTPFSDGRNDSVTIAIRTFPRSPPKVLRRRRLGGCRVSAR